MKKKYLTLHFGTLSLPHENRSQNYLRRFKSVILRSLVLLTISLSSVQFAIGQTQITSVTNPVTAAGADLVTGSLEVFDYDNDGDQDFIAYDGSALVFYQNNGSGVFSRVVPNVTLPLDNADNYIVADFDNDGDDDLFREASTTCLRNNGSGSFTSIANPLTAAGADLVTGSLEVFDYDNDGVQDFIAYDGSALVFYQNNGSGVFTRVVPNVTLPLDNADNYLIADFDNDGDGDIFREASTTCFRNNGNGTFTSITNPLIAAGADLITGSLEVFDFDADGDDDFIAYDGSAIVFYQNNGSGVFARVVPSSALPLDNSHNYIIADFDNDGDGDIFREASTTSFRTDGTSPGTNNQPPTLSSSSPADGATGIGVSDNIVLSFNEVISTAGSGIISILKSSDNSLVESFAGNSGNVSGAGSTTITINPTSDLDASTSYYVNIEDQTFFDADGMTYAGINDPATLNFETISTPTNNAPTASSFTTAGGPFENLTYTFSTGDFGYSDGDSDPLNNVLIEQVPTAGTLYVDANGNDSFDGGEALSNGLTVSKTDLDAGNLQYIQNGSISTSFQFEVNDGTEDSVGNYIATLGVVPVPTITLSITPSSRTESFTTPSEIKATLSNTYGANTTVNLSFSGTATGSGVDYTLSGNSIVVTAGSLENSITLTNVPDILHEENETVIVDIVSTVNGTENGTQQETYTIIDDDNPPNAILEVLSIYNPITDESGGQAYIRGKIDAVAGRTVTIPLSFSGTASGGGIDFSLTGTTITLSPGQVMDSVRVTSLFDGIEEGNETIIIDMDPPTNATEVGTQQVTLVIEDEDATFPSTTVTTSATNPTTSDPFPVNINFSENVTGLTLSDITVSNGTASNLSGSNNSYTANINPDADGLVSVSLNAGVVTDGFGNPNTASNTLSLEYDGTPSVVSINDPTITEGNTGASTLTFTVSLSSPAPAGGATVDYATSDNTATSGSDYVPSSGTLSFSVGETSKTIDVSALGDQRVEADETLNLILSNPTGVNVTIGDAMGIGTITNNDTATVTIADVNINEGSGTATVRLTLNNAVQGGLSLDVSTSNETATAGQDYTAVTNAPETFAGTAGEEETLTVSITNDVIVELDETIAVAMSNVVPANSGIDLTDINITDTATITIFDNDTATVTISDVSGNEDDGAITVTATLNNAVDGGFDVDVSTADGTATTADNDYIGITNQALTFAGIAGETETFTVTPNADADIEQNETLTVSMSNLVPTRVSASDINITDTATVTILNDDIVNGLQVAAEDTVFLIDFDNTVAGVNNGEYEGGGLSPSPASGQLDSNGLLIEGLSEGDTSFGGSHVSGDFARGASTGGVGAGGLYAFDVSNGGTSDIALGVQPGGSDFTPGAIILKFENRTGSTITDLNIAYEVFVKNNEARGNSITFETGGDFNNTTAVNGLDYVTPAATDGIFNTTWRRSLFQTNVSVNIADGGVYYLKWSSDDATGSSNRDEFAIDDIQIVANPSSSAPAVAGAYENLFIDGTYSLQNTVNVEGRLNVSGGSLVTNDNLTMKSIDYSGTIRTAILDPVLNGGSINGNVTVEQFYPANRAFRFVSSPVQNFSSTIYDNWQEGGSSTPGFGTQITGGVASDGFDQSTSNNPSAFIYDPAGTSGSTGWIAMGSTPTGTFVPNQTPLISSFGFRLLIRGDRTVSLTDQNAPATSTVLRSTGTLVTGDYTVDGDMFSSQLAFGADGSFYLAPNPYQAQVDLSQVLNGTNSEDINQGTYWFYQPLTDNYVAYDFATGGIQNGVSQFIQPGQGFFVQTDEASGSTGGYAPSFTYSESMKSTAVTATTTYSQSAGLYTIRMFTPETMGGAIATDMVRGFINPGFNNGIDTGDALKIIGESEQLGILSNGTLLSNERREAFLDNEVVPLQISQMESGNYSFELNFQLPDHDVFLVDNHLGTRTLIDQSQITNHSFDVDLSDAGSFAADRFQLEFETVTLSSGDLAFAKAVQLYPNPVPGDLLNISGLQAGEVKISITNMLGQRVADLEKSTTNGSVQVTGNSLLDAGVYLITLDQNGNTTTKRFVVK